MVKVNSALCSWNW